MKNLRKNKKGFTLIEVIVVLVILAIIIALAVPSVMKYVDDANEAKYLAQARAVYIAADAEIAKDYAPDSTLDFVAASDENKQLLGLVKAALNDSEIKLTEIKAFTTGTTEVTAGKKPSEIKSYNMKIDGKSIKITKNGTAEIVK